jgi:ferredoxin
MLKDENVCLHCGLCAERCPTYAWDMRKYVLQLPYAGQESGSGLMAHGSVRLFADARQIFRPAYTAQAPESAE